MREDTLHDATSEVAVDDNAMTRSSTPAFDGIERHSICLLQDCNSTFSFLSEQLIREVTVEKNADIGIQEAEERYCGTQLIDKEVGGSEVVEFVVPQGDDADEVQLS